MSARPTKRTRRQDQVELAFLEAVHRRRENNWRVWEALGELYTRAGRYEEGLAMDRRLADRHPEDPMVLYNLACSYALTGRPDDALVVLARALAAGYSDLPWMRRDKDLVSLHGDPRFEALLQRKRLPAK